MGIQDLDGHRPHGNDFYRRRHGINQLVQIWWDSDLWRNMVAMHIYGTGGNDRHCAILLPRLSVAERMPMVRQQYSFVGVGGGCQPRRAEAPRSLGSMLIRLT